MAATPDDLTWKVLPHDSLTRLADNCWRVEADVEGMSLRRCMVVARLRNGELVLHNAVALDDAGMAALEALGRPTWLVVPNGWHRLDAARYLGRYPDARVICPPGSRARVEEKVRVDETYETRPRPEPLDDTVTFEVLDGVAGAEGVMCVRSPDGVTVVFNDALFNLPHGRGLFWLIYGRLMGNAGGPKVTTITRWMMVKDRPAFRSHLERLAALPGLARVIPAHGRVIDTEAPDVLRAVAATL